MYRYKYGIFLLIFLFSQTVIAQADERVIAEIIEEMFEGLNARDVDKVRSLFVEDTKLITISKSSVVANKQIIDLDEFLNSLVQSSSSEWEEQIEKPEIRINESFAMAWIPYTFYYKNAISYCGVNLFIFTKDDDRWSIMGIVDTRHSTCQEELSKKQLELELHSYIDQWHKAAASADETYFFGFMKPNGVYIGTDPSELWGVDEFEAWSMEYFKRDEAWDFKPYNRNLYFSEKGNIVWFDELLDTWMGVCRGSGVLELESGRTWKLRHYHLSLTLLNDDMQEFLKIAPKREQKKPSRK